MQNKATKPILVLLAVAAVAGLMSFLWKAPPAPRSGGRVKLAGLKQTLAQRKGKVVVLLLGREGCPGTKRATAVLDTWAPQAARGVEVIRVDVPLPREKYKPLAVWDHPYAYALDGDRKLAADVEFFFYPTLYVYDREGQLRFEGGCQDSRLTEMVKVMLAEKAGAKKVVWTLPKLAVGSPAPDFKATDLAGRPTALTSLRGKAATLVFFSETSCPFTVKELPNLEMIAEAYRQKGLAVAVVNRRQTVAEIKPVYEQEAPGTAVVWDRRGEIFRAYGVDAVPYYYLLDAEGKVVRRRSFTAQAAAGSVGTLLGVTQEALRFDAAEAG